MSNELALLPSLLCAELELRFMCDLTPSTLLLGKQVHFQQCCLLLSLVYEPQGDKEHSLVISRCLKERLSHPKKIPLTSVLSSVQWG
jgi:hypothetical protein